MKRYIAIEGRGGSGKTYLSKLLQEKLDAKIFHLDEYGNDYEPFVGIPKLVEELKNTKAELVIFEGVGVFKEVFDEFKPFRILVDISDEVRKARTEGRDMPTNERSQDEWKKIYDIWFQAESEYFTDEVSTKADLIVNEEYDIDKILTLLPIH